MTFFSGFGLGTLLTPVFMIFFEIKIAIALTAVVHLLNNLFKVSLTFKNIHVKTIIYFGISSLIGAFVGAKVLHSINDTVLFDYSLYGNHYTVTLFKLIMSVLLIFFALAEMIKFMQFKVSKKALPWGGLLSGFFGGLSGHQGAMRSAFLLKSGLSKEQFIATGIIIACMVDIGRLFVYTSYFNLEIIKANFAILLCAVFSAFAGAFAGNQLLKKITLSFLQYTVSVFLILFSIALAMGII
jgi:uncharacterized membrane protein YfcA